ncbi:hypothetical protein NKG05_18425 [Oerskovia sp. M15]
MTVALTAPAGWQHAGQKDPLVVRATEPYGDPGFTPTSSSRPALRAPRRSPR